MQFHEFYSDNILYMFRIEDDIRIKPMKVHLVGFIIQFVMMHSKYNIKTHTHKTSFIYLCFCMGMKLISCIRGT